MNDLYEYRKARRITQEQLAAEIGLCQHVISRIEIDGIKVPYNVFTLMMWCQDHNLDLLGLVSPGTVIKHTHTREHRRARAFKQRAAA